MFFTETKSVEKMPVFYCDLLLMCNISNPFDCSDEKKGGKSLIYLVCAYNPMHSLKLSDCC